MDANTVTHFAWLPDGASPRLLADWLRQLPAEARVALLSDASHPAPIAVPDGARCRFDTWAPGATPAPELISGRPLYIPHALDRVPLRHDPKVLMPALAPHYGWLRTARMWGFTSLVFVDYGGETRMALPHLLGEFHQRHRGRRAFVVGNGPSLNDLDMTRLRDEITLGSNRCFLGYPQWGFPFTYWGVYDHFQIETYHGVYEDHVPADTVKFFPAEYLPVLRVANGCPVNSLWPDPASRAFSDDPARVYRGFTVTYMLLQIAAIMGCDPIILIGTDHRYHLGHRGFSPWLRAARRGVVRRLRGGRIYNAALAGARAWRQGGTVAPTVWTTSDAAGPTHFSADYTDGGRNQFLPPEPEEAERDFRCARAWAESTGRKILNATPGTALDTFEKVSFDECFRQ